MIKRKDQEWLEKVLKDCLKNIHENGKKSNDLENFRAIVSNLLRDIEKMVNETWAVWELEPDSKELRERFHLLEHCLSYIRRFCEGRIKGKYQK